jgi:hypothetical protein
MPSVDGGRATPAPRVWRFLLPWAVLPLALAIITLVDWLRHGRRRTQGKESS